MTTELTAREAPAHYVVDAIPKGCKCPKGYKQTEVGVIPEDWEIVEAGSIGRFKGGSGFPVVCQGLSSGEYPFFKVSDMNIEGNETYMETANNYISEEMRRRLGAYAFSPKTIVFAKVGAAVFLERKKVLTKPSCIDNNMAGYTLTDSRFDYRYIHYFLLKFRLSSLVATTALPSLSGSVLSRIKIPLPPTKAEQEAIAEALSDADALIEALEQLIAKKRQLKQGAMQELLTGKKRLPGFGGEWEVKALGELFNFSGGLSASREQLSSEGHCYLHYGDIHGSNRTYIDVCAEFADIPKLDVPLGKVSSSSLLNDGDVVFVDASEDDEGTSKHVVIENPEGLPFISGLHTIVAKSKTNELAHAYRRFCFQTAEVKAQFRFFAVGTKVSGISKTNIAKVELSFPSAPEQTAIATVLSDMDAEIAALEAQLAKARGIKQGMMQELLTGRIRLV